MRKELWNAIAGIDERFILEAAEVQEPSVQKPTAPEASGAGMRVSKRPWSWRNAAAIALCLATVAAGLTLFFRLAPLFAGEQSPDTSAPLASPPAAKETAERGGTSPDDALQAALAAREPKLLWAEDFLPERSREDAAVWSCKPLNCMELSAELFERLFPDAVVKEKSRTVSETTYELKLDGESFSCNFSESHIRLMNLSSERSEALLPQVTDWLAEKTGLEQRKWPGRVPPAIDVYTGCVDGLPISATADSSVRSFGVSREPNSISIHAPFTLGEQEKTISLYELFSPEELRRTIESRFDPLEPVVEAYRSCKLCYLYVAKQERLVPVWWVAGTSCNYETGRRKQIELFFDAETGQIYDLQMG